MIVARDRDNIIAYNMRNTNIAMFPDRGQKAYRFWSAPG